MWCLPAKWDNSEIIPGRHWNLIGSYCGNGDAAPASLGVLVDELVQKVTLNPDAVGTIAAMAECERCLQSEEAPDHVPGCRGQRYEVIKFLRRERFVVKQRNES